MALKRIHFSELRGEPRSPGAYVAPGVGLVALDEDNLENLRNYDFNAYLEMEDINSITSTEVGWTVLFVIPG